MPFVHQADSQSQAGLLAESVLIYLAGGIMITLT